MREHGVRTISDLKMLDDATALELAEKTSATKSAVEMARRRSRQDGSVEFLESLRCTLVAGQALKKCPEVRAEPARRSEEHTSELQSLMRISYAVFCLKKKNK